MDIITTLFDYYLHPQKGISASGINISTRRDAERWRLRVRFTPLEISKIRYDENSQPSVSDWNPPLSLRNERPIQSIKQDIDKIRPKINARGVREMLSSSGRTQRLPKATACVHCRQMKVSLSATALLLYVSTHDI